MEEREKIDKCWTPHLNTSAYPPTLAGLTSKWRLVSGSGSGAGAGLDRPPGWRICRVATLVSFLGCEIPTTAPSIPRITT